MTPTNLRNPMTKIEKDAITFAVTAVLSLAPIVYKKVDGKCKERKRLIDENIFVLKSKHFKSVH